MREGKSRGNKEWLNRGSKVKLGRESRGNDWKCGRRVRVVKGWLVG